MSFPAWHFALHLLLSPYFFHREQDLFLFPHHFFCLEKSADFIYCLFLLCRNTISKLKIKSLLLSKMCKYGHGFNKGSKTKFSVLSLPHAYYPHLTPMFQVFLDKFIIHDLRTKDL